MSADPWQRAIRTAIQQMGLSTDEDAQNNLRKIIRNRNPPTDEKEYVDFLVKEYIHTFHIMVFGKQKYQTRVYTVKGSVKGPFSTIDEFLKTVDPCVLELMRVVLNIMPLVIKKRDTRHLFLEFQRLLLNFVSGIKTLRLTRDEKDKIEHMTRTLKKMTWVLKQGGRTNLDPKLIEELAALALILAPTTVATVARFYDRFWQDLREQFSIDGVQATIPAKQTTNIVKYLNSVLRDRFSRLASVVRVPENDRRCFDAFVTTVVDCSRALTIRSTPLERKVRHCRLVLAVLQRFFFLLRKQIRQDGYASDFLRTVVEDLTERFRPILEPAMTCEELLTDMRNNAGINPAVPTRQSQRRRQEWQAAFVQLLKEDWLGPTAQEPPPVPPTVQTAKQGTQGQQQKAVRDRSLFRQAIGAAEVGQEPREMPPVVSFYRHKDRRHAPGLSPEQLQRWNRQVQRRKRLNTERLLQESAPLFREIAGHAGGFDRVYLVDGQNISYRLLGQNCTFEERGALLTERTGAVKDYVLEITSTDRDKHVLWIVVTQGNVRKNGRLVSVKKKTDDTWIVSVACALNDGMDCFRDAVLGTNPMDDLLLLNLYTYLTTVFRDRMDAGEKSRLARYELALARLYDIYHGEDGDEFDFVDYVKAKKAIERVFANGAGRRAPDVYLVSYDGFRDFERIDG